MSDALALAEPLPHPVPYADRLEARQLASVSLVVLHCTELPDLATARRYAEVVHYPESGTGNCGHLYIDRDGQVEQYVPLDRVAHHVVGYNERSVGIELVNVGRFPNWYASTAQEMKTPYPTVQIQRLIQVIHRLQMEIPSLTQIAGHEALDTRRVPASDDPGIRVPRKMDPGPLFPWPAVMEEITLKRLGAAAGNDAGDHTGSNPKRV
ncbi:MAG: N-acetylmuramoyl-L-alanine amidase [Pseudomonadota bacterium]